jgi:hypothetical protein
LQGNRQGDPSRVLFEHKKARHDPSRRARNL